MLSPTSVDYVAVVVAGGDYIVAAAVAVVGGDYIVAVVAAAFAAVVGAVVSVGA